MSPKWVVWGLGALAKFKISKFPILHYSPFP